jgi:glucose-6-phosphate 1-dehydrogenase
MSNHPASGELISFPTCPRFSDQLLIVFGGTGDLMARKLLPALWHLKQGDLKERTIHVLGVARTGEHDDQSYRHWVAEALRESGSIAAKDWIKNCAHFQSIGDGESQEFAALAGRIRQIEQQHALPGCRVFYLALPPSGVPGTITGLGESGLHHGPSWVRLVVEKPFGEDLDTSSILNRQLRKYFEENQLYRIDHYLGKETVQNLLVFRFANPLFESVWNRDRVHSVEILVAEEVGVGGRARYYDRAGALRDMIQNHLTQLFCLVAMEPPAVWEAEAIRDEKLKVLRSVQPIDPGEVTWGQYGPGVVNGETCPGYLDEVDVRRNSQTETFVELKLQAANWRWQGIPFILRTGKRLHKRVTRITVRFQRPPVSLFRSFSRCQISPNELSISLQPDEGFDLRFEVKNPGQDIRVQTGQLRFRYSELFGALPEAYEALLLDVFSGDQTLFVRGDEAESAWRLYDPLLKVAREVKVYAAGGWGPVRSECVEEH